jgi:hypothetical protein
MDGMIKTATPNNAIYCDVTINPPLCTIVTSGFGGPRTHEPLFTRFSRYSPHLLVNIACCFLQEVVFSANGIAYNNGLYNNAIYCHGILLLKKDQTNTAIHRQVERYPLANNASYDACRDHWNGLYTERKEKRMLTLTLGISTIISKMNIVLDFRHTSYINCTQKWLTTVTRQINCDNVYVTRPFEHPYGCVLITNICKVCAIRPTFLDHFWTCACIIMCSEMNSSFNSHLETVPGVN